MNKLSTAQRARIVGCLVEGNSIRSTCRMTGAAKGTVLKLLVDLGLACEDYHNRTVVNLPCKRIQADEIWSFVGMKEKRVPESRKGDPDIGDVWTWTALDPDSKLMASWLVGGRDADYALEFLSDLAQRLRGHVQLTTDGHGAYLGAVDDAFGIDVSYAQLVKHYGTPPDAERRYSPAVCTGVHTQTIIGRPDPAHVCTSHVERSNLTIRMSSRRFTRLTNAFSKKVENHRAAIALHFMHYNFARIHQTLRVTPAMEIGLSDHVWEIEEIVQLLG
jgi:IS1 family transposase